VDKMEEGLNTLLTNQSTYEKLREEIRKITFLDWKNYSASFLEILRS